MKQDKIKNLKEQFIVMPKIEVILNKKIYALGVNEIKDYTNEKIAFILESIELVIYGVDLAITYLTEDSLEINGKIKRIEYNI